ncbi:MAG TPA: hypothetical protein VF623_11145 [Segetibacter sp.]|jgi:hypothetical protein
MKLRQTIEEYFNYLPQNDNVQKDAYDKIKSILKGKITDKCVSWKK